MINIVADIAAGPDLNPRQEWILEQLKQGTEIQRVTVERQFGVGEKTAKRDLSELVEWGLIEYMRRGRKGSYRALVRRSWQNSDRIGPRGISSH
ncbi:MAG: DeoR family transcriptional regulator [Rhodopirellula sp.]|nr:DeoR family transcriptional regulator [Rhodopirellula sp.]